MAAGHVSENVPYRGFTLLTKIWVSKETVVLRRWEIETEIYFIKRVDKGRMATVKDLESFPNLSRWPFDLYQLVW